MPWPTWTKIYLCFLCSWDDRCMPPCLAYWLRWGLSDFSPRLPWTAVLQISVSWGAGNGGKTATAPSYFFLSKWESHLWADSCTQQAGSHILGICVCYMQGTTCRPQPTAIAVYPCLRRLCASVISLCCHVKVPVPLYTYVPNLHIDAT
jgi:hypothetical protein